MVISFPFEIVYLLLVEAWEVKPGSIILKNPSLVINVVRVTPPVKTLHVKTCATRTLTGLKLLVFLRTLKRGTGPGTPQTATLQSRLQLQQSLQNPEVQPPEQ